LLVFVWLLSWPFLLFRLRSAAGGRRLHGLTARSAFFAARPRRGDLRAVLARVPAVAVLACVLPDGVWCPVVVMSCSACDEFDGGSAVHERRPVDEETQRPGSARKPLPLGESCKRMVRPATLGTSAGSSARVPGLVTTRGELGLVQGVVEGLPVAAESFTCSTPRMGLVRTASFRSSPVAASTTSRRSRMPSSVGAASSVGSKLAGQQSARSAAPSVSGSRLTAARSASRLRQRRAPPSSGRLARARASVPGFRRGRTMTRSSRLHVLVELLESADTGRPRSPGPSSRALADRIALDLREQGLLEVLLGDRAGLAGNDGRRGELVVEVIGPPDGVVTDELPGHGPPRSWRQAGARLWFRIALYARPASRRW